MNEATTRARAIAAANHLLTAIEQAQDKQEPFVEVLSESRLLASALRELDNYIGAEERHSLAETIAFYARVTPTSRNLRELADFATAIKDHLKR